MQQDVHRRSKVILIGDGGTGKTSFVTRFIEGNFRREYIATVGAVTHPVILTTTMGERIQVTLWDTAGQEMNAGLAEAYYIETDIAVIFFDLTSRITLRNVNTWHRRALSTCPNVPVIVVGNKADVKDRKVRAPAIKKDIPRGCEYFEISAKTHYNFEKVLHRIVRIITGRPDVTLVPNIAIEPAQLEMTQEAHMLSEMVTSELLHAKEVDLPDEFDREE